MTNCKACGFATCMAFAAVLREGETGLEACPPLAEEPFRQKRALLEKYLESYGWQALDAF
jgi:ArsR family metal-binding transcriptional regulator